MAELFELSAALRIDLSAFERDIQEALAMAGQMDQALTLLRADALAAMSAVRMASAGGAMPGASAGLAGARAEDVAAAVKDAMRGVTVSMDGHTVGRLVASGVDEQLGLTAQTRRYTG